MLKWFLAILSAILFIGCSADDNKTNTYRFADIPSDSSNITKRFQPMEGFERVETESESFKDWLRHLPLKPKGSKLYFYTGDEALTKDGHEAIVDMPVKNNTQNSTVLMLRLWAEYQFQDENFERLTFRLKNGKDLPYYKWQKGYRPAIQNEKVIWQDMNTPDTTYNGFQQYLNLALSQVDWQHYLNQMEKITATEIEIGDIVYQKSGGSHAMMVADLAMNDKGQKIALFVEGASPPVDLHVAANKQNPAISPWYELVDNEPLLTPFWAFSDDDFYRFSGKVMSGQE